MLSGRGKARGAQLNIEPSRRGKPLIFPGERTVACFPVASRWMNNDLGDVHVTVCPMQFCNVRVGWK